MAKSPSSSSKEKNTQPKKSTKNIPAGEGAEIPENPVTIIFQYLKDLSFESPLAPNIFINQKKSPEVDLSINVGCDPIQNKLFEVTLVLHARIFKKTDRKDENHFLVEMKYAGLVQLHEKLEKSLRNPALLIEAPRLLFPFARSILSNITRDGGFPPLSIQPIDFSKLYRNELMRRKQNVEEK